MFVVQIKKKGWVKASYCAFLDEISYARKDANKYTREGAEMAAKRMRQKHNLREEEIFVVSLEEAMRTKTNKFGAIPTWYREADGQLYDTQPLSESKRFDSKIEAKVYQALRREFRREHVVAQYPLMIKPATKLYKQLDWLVDFRVHSDQVLLNIEVKGLALPEFKRSVQFLQACNHNEWARLIIISEEAKPIDKHLNAISLNHFLRNLNEGIYNNAKPKY